MSVQTDGQRVWCDVVADTAIAKTKATFDAINNNQARVKIEQPTAQQILGFMIGYNATLITDAENTPDLVVRVNSKAQGISDEDIVIPNGGSDGNATSAWAPLTTKFVPFRITGKNPLFNSEFTFKASPTVTNTGGLDIVVGVVYSDQLPDQQFSFELMSQMHKRPIGGAFNADAAKAHGTGLAAVTLSSISIPTGPKMLLALLAKINPNAITASKPIGGFMEFQSAGIPNFSPQIWPLCTFWNPVLGTTVTEEAISGEGRYFPTRFPLTGAEVTVSVKSTLIIAASDAPDTTQGLFYE